MIAHVAPEAFNGGPIAAVEEGDMVSIDVAAGRLDLEIPPETLAARLRKWQAPAPRYATGVFAKYSTLVASASEGAVTSKF
jgi:dihydroxy-acid dehydratase